jgi:putative peptidoglycan lipid II flippase
MVTGALLHFAIQFPLAHKLGFRFRFPPHVTDDVRKIGKLTAPRLVDLGVAQVLETVQLSLISFLSKASYAFFILANNLQLYPVSFLGTSLAKAAMPVLTRLEDDHQEFRRVILSILSQMIFLILPIVTILIVLRVPVVRLAFGTDKYDWDATVQTGWILTVFVISVPMQAIVTLLNRGFFALHDTKTPVIISVSADIVTIILDFIFILVFHWPVSSVALAFSIGMIIQFCLLYSLLFRKLGFVPRLRDFSSAVTPLFASFAAGSVMYILIRFFDRSVWVKQLSFIGFSPTLRSLPFQSFVVDTRYTLNLVLLTCSVSSIGLFIYLSLCFLFRSEALFSFSKVIHGRIRHLLPGSRPQEPITPTGNDL